MIESRCGILCSKCSYKKEVSCNGCTNISNPFWGECSVKMCCESKDLDNCGPCSEFPCNMLNAFSYDKEQGDNGKRINQCKIWSSE